MAHSTHGWGRLVAKARGTQGRCHLRRFALVSLTNQPHLLRKHHSMRTTLRERHSTRGLRTAFTISIISWIWSLCALINAASAMPDVALPLAAPPAVPFASALPLSSSSTTGVVLPPPLSFDSTPLEGAGAGSEPSGNASTHAPAATKGARGGSVRALRGRRKRERGHCREVGG